MDHIFEVFFMAVPAEIRAVQRPPNTVVENTGRPGPKQYIVRERTGTRYVQHGNPQPHNGRVIGYIHEGAFVPAQERCAQKGSGFLSYGSAAFVKSVVSDIMDDLLAVFDIKEAYEIIAIATLRIIEPRIAIRRYSTHYNRTFVSIHYPGIGLSSNTVTSLLERVGKDKLKRTSFFLRRINAVCKNHHIVIDGSLIQDTSTLNDLSAFSHKSRLKGCKDISIIYAYDVELKEPICAQVFPGNYIDASSYATFLRENKINKGILITDKGFPPSKIKDIISQYHDLHFLTPLKRNDSKIIKFLMYDFEGILKNIDGEILYKKQSIGNGKYLYSFRDSSRAGKEDTGYLRKAKFDDDFDLDDYRIKVQRFGTIVFESDLDLPPRIVYLCYCDRWLLELIFRQYKSIEDLDQTQVQSDFAVIGSEFINFITTLATCRMVKIAQDSELLIKMSFGELMRQLSQIWRQVDAPSEARSDDNYWVYPFKGALQEMEALGLSIPVEKPEPKKRGRPRTRPEFVGPKRPKGRPRKIRVEQSASS